MAYLIKTNGMVKWVDPKNGEDFKFEELHDLIDGYIEIVRVNDKQILVVDEEGRPKDKEINAIASSFAGQVIVGDVVLCNNNQVL